MNWNWTKLQTFLSVKLICVVDEGFDFHWNQHNILIAFLVPNNFGGFGLFTFAVRSFPIESCGLVSPLICSKSSFTNAGELEGVLESLQGQQKEMVDRQKVFLLRDALEPYLN